MKRNECAMGSGGHLALEGIQDLLYRHLRMRRLLLLRKIGDEAMCERVPEGRIQRTFDAL